MKEKNITLCGHGSGKPSLKRMDTYLSSRYAQKAPNGKRKGLVAVRRLKAMDSGGRRAFHNFYRMLLGRNIYSQSKRSYVFSIHRDGHYYSDCSSSGCACFKKAGYNVSLLNTAGIYNSSKFEKVPVKIEDGHITNPEVLQVGDALLFAGNDPSRPMQIGHVEFVYEMPESTDTGKNEADKAAVKVDSAKSFGSGRAGTYIVNTKSDPLSLRSGAGTGKPKIASLKKGSKVQCYGYYTEADGAKWLLVAAGGNKGFAHSGYLKKA